MPDISDDRVTWHVGDVETTIQDIDLTEVGGTRLFIFDLDLFGPSLVAWEAIRPHLRSGDILYFDEAHDSHERVLLEAFVLPTVDYDGLGSSPFACAISVKEPKS